MPEVEYVLLLYFKLLVYLIDLFFASVCDSFDTDDIWQWQNAFDKPEFVFLQKQSCQTFRAKKKGSPETSKFELLITYFFFFIPIRALEKKAFADDII